MGLGESYMEGWWDVESLDECIFRVIRGRLKEQVHLDLETLFLFLGMKVTNRQRKSKAGIVGEHHYDRGNDLFEAMLDKNMAYSCGFWDDANSLDEAQENKLDLICKKLGLEPGMTVLDIGCGWGSFSKFAAERYGVSVLGINNSREQAELGTRRCEGLPVEIRFQDYREVEGTYDRLVSIGMFEHVGSKNYSTYMQVASRCMRDDGLFLLHTIGSNKQAKRPDTWTVKYIFPRSEVPSIRQMAEAIEEYFVMEDWHNISADYDRTLMVWKSNFDAHWDELRDNYGDEFYRMWSYFLLMCAGSFRARYNQVWQILLSKQGIVGGYHRSA